MYYVELNGFRIFEGSLDECKRQAKIAREFLTKYKYYPVHSTKKLQLDEVYLLAVSMDSIEF